MLYYLITLLIILLTIRWLKSPYKFENTSIPYIKPWPIFGNMMEIFLRKISFPEQLKKIYDLDPRAKYFGYYDFSSPVIVIRDPELIKDIGIKNFDSFIDHRGFVDPALDPLFGRNLFSLRGDTWRELRNLLSPSFTSSKMKVMFKLMCQCSDNFSSYFVEQMVKSKIESQTIASKEVFTRYTNDVIATCAFGITIDSMRDPDNDFYRIGRKSANFEGSLGYKMLYMRSFPRLSKWLKLKLIDSHADTFFTRLVSDTVKVRSENNISRADMIQLMMETKNPNHNGRLNITDMTAQAFVFFLAGFDTTAGLMCFMAHYLAENPEMQEELQQEVDQVYEDFNGNPSYEAINGMKYLDAFLNETMRIYPIASMVDRVCIKDYELPPVVPGEDKYILKAGDYVWFPVYPIHRDPNYYPDPDKFDPGRFLDNAKAFSNSPTYLPFGIGPRMCIGNRFALLETKILFFYLVKRCWFKPSKKMLRPLRLSKTSIAMTPQGGFWVDLQVRK
ncbi:cytochrome P450 9e2-like [Microplitis mediator]|uniref:cytochrome P450 9e2-like n=1 Tax=Microplitis mediator TaxID=375433 RepID=UPI002554A99B|nr:cytochrome P450 9e2-like [Microplitis mediator]